MNIGCTNMSVCICPFTNTLQIRGVCGHGLSYVLIHDVCSSPCMCLFCSGVVTQVQLSIIYSFLHAKCVLRCCLLKCSLMSVDCDLKKKCDCLLTSRKMFKSMAKQFNSSFLPHAMCLIINGDYKTTLFFEVLERESLFGPKTRSD